MKYYLEKNKEGVFVPRRVVGIDPKRGARSCLYKEIQKALLVPEKGDKRAGSNSKDGLFPAVLSHVSSGEKNVSGEVCREYTEGNGVGQSFKDKMVKKTECLTLSNIQKRYSNLILFDDFFVNDKENLPSISAYPGWENRGDKDSGELLKIKIKLKQERDALSMGVFNIQTARYLRVVNRLLKDIEALLPDNLKSTKRKCELFTAFQAKECSGEWVVRGGSESAVSPLGPSRLGSPNSLNSPGSPGSPGSEFVITWKVSP